MISTKAQVKLETGLHARPGTKFVQLAKKFEADIKLTNGEKTADAKSILEVLTLGVYKDTVITITADGSDEGAAIEELAAYISQNE